MKRKPLLFLALIALTACTGGTSSASTSTSNKPNSSTNSSTSTDEGDKTYEMKVPMSSTWLLPKAEAADKKVIEGAPELMIIEAVCDTNLYNRQAISVNEYVKVYNNTASSYSLLNHRLMLADPTSGQNGESEEAKKGLKPMSVNYLYNGFIMEDIQIPAFGSALLWMRPYFWQAASGSNGFTGSFDTSNVIHKDSINKGIDTFKSYWKLGADDLVVEVCNQPLVGTRNNQTYPIISPGAGTQYSHLNSTLLRSIEISKFEPNDTEDGLPREVVYDDIVEGEGQKKLIYPAKLQIENNYKTMTEEERNDPMFIAGKNVFNTVSIVRKDNNDYIDGYHYIHTWNYFKSISKINFCGRINPDKLGEGEEANFSSTSNPGTQGWEHCTGLQFRPPLAGERLMQWQLPLRERVKYETYLLKKQYDFMRFHKADVVELRFVDITIELYVDPNDPTITIDWKYDEADTDARRSGAAPGEVKVINLTR